LHQAPISQLNQFFSVQDPKSVYSAATSSNNLKLVNQTSLNNSVINRYQQFYKGIPIFGAQVTVSQNSNALKATDKNVNMLSGGLVNGHIFSDIELNTNPGLSPWQALQIAKGHYSKSTDAREEKTELQIRPSKDNQLTLTYRVSFRSFSQDKPAWPFFIIDAQTGEILKQWNNIQHYKDSGPGGNEKVHEYWYGKDGLPALEVSKKGRNCTLDDGKVAAVNLKSKWDWEDKIRTPIRYSCNYNIEDSVHGAYSVGNDAYFFGHIVVDLYKNWYGVNVLQDNQGKPQKLIMRVHFGSDFDNAFWDGETMAFGDGFYLYPLVSLDIAGHEVSHGFTQQHANLEYHDESGALNEAFSDMGGQASRAYLLEKYPALHNKAYLTPDKITWRIGETVIPSSFKLKAIRFLDVPSLDGESADCLDKNTARANHSICAISYPELLANIESQHLDEDKKQGILVHTASGVFNRAFYLMSQQLGIKQAFQVMVIANTKYWTPTTNFKEGACGVIYSTKDLNIKTDSIVTIFKKVGISTDHCK
jgi:vibriolysin